MATIKFSIKSKKNFAPIYVRMQHSKLFDFEKPTPIHLEPKNFDDKNQRIRRVAEIPQHEELNNSLSNLKNHLFSEFNIGIISGQEFNRNWFDDVISKFFNLKLVDKTNLHKIFFTDFCDYWFTEKAPTYKISSEKYISGVSLKNYETFVNTFKRFQGKNKIKFKDLTEAKIDQFASFLIKNEHYGHGHASRLLARFQFFCKQAEKDSVEVNPSYQNRIFLSSETKKDCVDPYLNEKEILSIYNLDLSDDERLDNVRDNLIISVWTGLRVSDFLRLSINNIQNNCIEVKSTQKTGIGVLIPIHPQVQAILDKRNGNLPKTLSDQKYNDYIKEVAKLAGLNQIIYGSKLQLIKDNNGKEVPRKVLDNYPKHKLITSHIGRRSFATNLFGKVPNSVIMASAGWKSEQMMLKYIKKTKNDHVEILAKFWNTQETPSSQLKTVNE